MRELKFRAWSPSENKMYYSNPVGLDYEKHGLVSYSSGYEFGISPLTGGIMLLLPVDYPVTNAIDGKLLRIEKRMMPVKNAEIMQYTGLKDKNGVEIYEGDIISVQYSRFHYSHGHLQYYLNFLCFFKEGAFCVGDKNESTNVKYLASVGDSDSFNIEVIGNIYENPELLNNQQ